VIPQHLSKTAEHPTPQHVVAAARRVLGGFDLDPASSVRFNRRVRAESIIALPDDGLALAWDGRVFLNPPGGRAPKKWAKYFESQSNATIWWRKLCNEWAARRVTAAVFIGFTLELLRSAQTAPGRRTYLHPFDFSICVPRERLCFGGDQPTHANVIVYLGRDRAKFAGEFSPLGRCL
jgi:hypothetical protein